MSQNAPHQEVVIELLSERQQGGRVRLQVSGQQVMDGFEPQQHLNKQTNNKQAINTQTNKTINKQHTVDDRGSEDQIKFQITL